MWTEDPSTESGWRWDTTADAEATSVLDAPGSAVEVVPSAAHVLDLSIGAGGGGRDGGALPAIDPDAPVSHVDELAPAGTPASSAAETTAAWGVLVGCPACGSGVTPDRLRR